MTTSTIRVTGMTCGHCVQAVGDALKSVPGVASADVNLDAGNAEVRYDEERTTPEALAAAVQEEGYEAETLPA
jgi:copper chaperone